MSYLLKPPTVKEGPAGFGRLFWRYKIDRGDSLLVFGTTVVRQRTPAVQDTQTADYCYLGGGEYFLSQVEYDILYNAGYGPNITIIANPSVVVPGSLNGTINTDYSVTFTATGGGLNKSYSLSPTSNVLPAGLRLDPSGVLSGRPSASATYSGLKVTVTDNYNLSATSSTFTIVIS